MIKTPGFIYILIVVLAAIAAIISYSPSLKGEYFADDFLYWFKDSPLSQKTLFISQNEYSCRPVEVLFLSSCQHLSPSSTLPIHLTQLSLHLLLSLLIMIWMLRRGLPKSGSVMAFCIMALSQANSHAVSSLDTFSQITGTLFGYMSIILYMSFLRDPDKTGTGSEPSIRKNTRNWRLRKVPVPVLSGPLKNETTSRRIGVYSGSILIFVLALLCKETSMSVLPIVFLITAFNYMKHHDAGLKKAITHFVPVIPFVLAVSAFMLLRRYLNLTPAEIGDGRYNIGFGFNIVNNFIMSLLQCLQPRSSVELYFDIVNRRFISLFPVLLFTCLFAVISFWGIRISRYRTFAFAAILILPFSLFPVILLNHVSELYAYNMMPLISVILGIGLSSLVDNLKSSSLKIAVWTVFAGFLLWNTNSLYKKSALMFENGAEAKRVLAEIQPFCDKIPNNGKLVLVNPSTSHRTEYSIYKRTGFRLLEGGLQEIERRSGRNDFQTVIITEAEINSIDTINSLILLYENGSIHLINRAIASQVILR